MSSSLTHPENDDIRLLYADAIQVRAKCHASLNCGNNLVIDPQPFGRALSSLTPEHRSNLRLVLMAAQIGTPPCYIIVVAIPSIARRRQLTQMNTCA